MRLITNLSGVMVAVNEAVLRLECTAIIIRPNEPGVGNTPQRVVGYSRSSASPTFDLHPKCDYLDYELSNLSHSNSMIAGDSGEYKPMASGHVLKFADGTTIALYLEDQDRPLDIEDFPEEDWSAIYEALEVKSLDYWVAPGYTVAIPVSVEEAGPMLARLRSVLA